MKKAKKREENKVEYGTVSLPLPLIKRIKEKIKGTGVPSVSSYVTYLLRQILSSAEVNSGKVISKEDEEEVRRRLKNLGYLD
jgi:Arc/MetJ-type ribon-helix-helix transcriptional regulator